MDYINTTKKVVKCSEIFECEDMYLFVGKIPSEACELVINEIKQRTQETFEISIIAVNMKGEYGAGTTVNKWTDPLNDNVSYDGFPFVVWTREMDEPKCICQEAQKT